MYAGAFDPQAHIGQLSSTLGKQIPSNRKSASAYSFGHADKSPNAKSTRAREGASLAPHPRR